MLLLGYEYVEFIGRRELPWVLPSFGATQIELSARWAGEGW